jgi:hypothetical protein
MRIASRFQRPGRSSDRRVRALIAGIGIGLISYGCFFELEPVVDLDGGIGGGGSAGSASGEAGESPMGGDGGSGVAGAGAPGDGCANGQKRCDGSCVEATPFNGCANDDCAPCLPVADATLTCASDSGGCRVADCNPGFADCNGDTRTYDGSSTGDGCEYSFATGGGIRPTAQQPLQVPRGNGISISDGSRDDWQGIPAYQLLQVCNTGDCNDDALPEITAVAEVPPRRDLDAYFRVAWSPDFFYVLGDVYDDSLFANGEANSDGRCQNGALCEDALTVFFDGKNDRAVQGDGYAFDDPRVFLGLAGQAYRVSGFLEAGDVDLKPVQNGACYRIEAQVAWTMIVGVQANAVVEGQFPPATGQNYGFDISVNDWDPGVSDQTARRESHLFWVNPGPQYHFKTIGFGAMTLVDSLSPAETLQ